MKREKRRRVKKSTIAKSAKYITKVTLVERVPRRSATERRVLLSLPFYPL
jgi:hypothetical protein